MIFSHEYFMEKAIIEAQKANEEDEVPVGAIVVANNSIIARAHNMTQRLNDATAHAEMLAITSASEFLGGKYLKGCTLYVTLEPCAMCAGAIALAQADQLVYGASDPKRGYTKYSTDILSKQTKVTKGVLESKSTRILQDFFKRKR